MGFSCKRAVIFPCGYLKRPTAEPSLLGISFNCDRETVCYVIWFRATTFVKYTRYAV